MINKNILPVATVLVLSSGINSFANGNETNIEYRNFINKTGIVTAQAGLNVRKTPKVENGNKLFAISYNTKVDVLDEENGWYKIKVNNTEGWANSQYIKISSDNNENTTNNIYKYVNANRVNFRQGASTSSKIYQVLNKGDKVKFISNNGEWSKIEFNNKTGYIYSDYLSNNNESSTNIIYKYVNANRVNFRQGASTSSKIYQVLNKGDKVKFISNNGEWSKIEFNNKTGYMHSDYLSNIKPSSTDNSNTGSSIATKRQKIVSLAKAQIGKPYAWGAEGPNSFDCSGLMTYIYKNAVGINLPRTSTEQSTFGTTVSRSNLQEGDLIFSSTNGTGKVSHVGIYVGNGEMIHSPKPGDVVKKTSINNSYWNSVYLWSKRVL